MGMQGNQSQGMLMMSMKGNLQGGQTMSQNNLQNQAQVLMMNQGQMGQIGRNQSQGSQPQASLNRQMSQSAGNQSQASLNQPQSQTSLNNQISQGNQTMQNILGNQMAMMQGNPIQMVQMGMAQNLPNIANPLMMQQQFQLKQMEVRTS